MTPFSLQAVSGFPVADDLLDPAAEAAMGHIELGKWADLSPQAWLPESGPQIKQPRCSKADKFSCVMVALYIC